MKNNLRIGDWVTDGDWLYGQIIDIVNFDALIEFNTSSGGGSVWTSLDELRPDKSPCEYRRAILLKPLPQYHFDRDDWTRVFYEVFTCEEMMDIGVGCQSIRHLDEFTLMRWEDEFYIIHRNSGVMINWYKHAGRTNTCNRSDFTLNDFRAFLTKLREDLVWNRVIKDDTLLNKLRAEHHDWEVPDDEY
jgi:hypothetical protein